MSRFQIRGLASGVVVVVGWDRAMGFWCEIQRPGRAHVTYDGTTTEDGTTSIAGVLHALIEAEVIARAALAEAEALLAVGDLEDVPDDQVGLRVAAEVVLHLREAANE